MIDSRWSIEFQYLILAAAIRGDLLRQIPLDPALFQGREKGPKSPIQEVAEIAVAFFDQYGRTPALEEFRQIVSESGRVPARKEALDDVVAAVLTVELPEDALFVRDRVKQQLELRAFEQAMLTTAPMLSQPDRIEEAREIMAKAMTPIAVDDGRVRTVRVFGDSEARLAMWKKGEEYGERIPTGFAALDDALSGGPTRRETFYFLAPPKGAKTASLLKVALTAARKNYGVYMVTYEMQALRMALRADRALSRMSKEELRDDVEKRREPDRPDREGMISALQSLENAYRGYVAAGAGEITIDEHPTMSPTSVATARRRVQEIRRKGGKVDVVVLDYLNIMGAAKEDKEQRRELKKISQEMSQMAKDLDVLVWSAALVNRKAVSKEIVRKTDIAEAFEVIAVLDGAVAICAPEELIAINGRRFWIAAAREEADETSGGDYIVDFARQTIDTDEFGLVAGALEAAAARRAAREAAKGSSSSNEDYVLPGARD